MNESIARPNDHLASRTAIAVLVVPVAVRVSNVAVARSYDFNDRLSEVRVLSGVVWREVYATQGGGMASMPALLPKRVVLQQTPRYRAVQLVCMPDGLGHRPAATSLIRDSHQPPLPPSQQE